MALALAVTTAFGKPIIKERVRILAPRGVQRAEGGSQGAGQQDQPGRPDPDRPPVRRGAAVQGEQGLVRRHVHPPARGRAAEGEEEAEGEVGQGQPPRLERPAVLLRCEGAPLLQDLDREPREVGEEVGPRPGRALSQDHQEDLGVVARQLLSRADRGDLPEPGAHHDDVPSSLPEHALPAERQGADARVDWRAIREVKSRSGE